MSDDIFDEIPDEVGDAPERMLGYDQRFVLDELKVIDWRATGDGLKITMRAGPMEMAVEVSTSIARQIALEVLMQQGPYLVYRPPNARMAEHHSAPESVSTRLKNKFTRTTDKGIEITSQRLRRGIRNLIDQHGRTAVLAVVESELNKEKKR